MVGLPAGARGARAGFVKDSAGPKTKIDSFILAKLTEKKLQPSPEADLRC
jgi:hypothetical protein